MLSYAGTGASAIWNVYRPNDTLLLADGLSVFRVEVPPSLYGVSLANSGIRRDTGCNVVAIERDGVTSGNPPITTVFQPGMRLVLIGDSADEGRFADIHRPARPR